MTTMIFYERASALSRERHQHLKVDPRPHDFSFARPTNSVLVAVSEFREAARDYPIVFVGGEGGGYTVAALVGLGDKDNLMIGEDGRWEAGTYIPAFARRYPFILASTAGSDDMVVCVDEACAGLGAERGEALFAQDGSPSPYLDKVVDFLKLFHQDMTRTAQFAQRLHSLGLLSQRVVNVERDGKRQVLEGVWTVDEARLAALDDAQLLQLARSGDLSLIYAHLASLDNVRRLAARLDLREKAALAVLAEQAPEGGVH